MNKEYFLTKLKEKFTNNLSKYDYSLIPNEFKAVDKIKIICKEHGCFEQTVNAHLSKCGCPECGRERIKTAKLGTNEDFINKAKLIHGDKYNYNKVVYRGYHRKVIITCPTHGDFEQLSSTHLSGFGCSYCSGKRVNTEEFIKNAKIVHGNSFNYDKVNYIDNVTKIIITCPIHGDFLQAPATHLNGFKCVSCRNDSLRSNAEEFINKANKIHNNKFTYEKINYITNNIKITITCPTHGDFQQTPGHHLTGKGCIKCAGCNKSNTKEFINKAKLIHGDKYNYNKVNYINNNTKVIITCPDHGDFQQTPGHHLTGKGCPICRESNGEKHIVKVLHKFNITHIREYRILPHRYKYDFYLPDYNIYIEYHGVQHYKPIEWFGGKKAFKKQSRNDKIKIELIKRSTGLLIVLKYTSDSLSKIEDELLQLFSVIHPQFLTNTELSRQEIIDSNIFLINNGIIHTRN